MKPLAAVFALALFLPMFHVAAKAVHCSVPMTETSCTITNGALGTVAGCPTCAATAIFATFIAILLTIKVSSEPVGLRLFAQFSPLTLTPPPKI